MKLGEHLNSLLLNMCDDVTLSRMSLRTVLDICSKHIRNSTCDPPFSYIRKLVRLVLGSLSQVHKFSITLFEIFCQKPAGQHYFRLDDLEMECFLNSFLISSLSPTISQLDGLLTDRESLPERSKEIRERLRGKGLPSGERTPMHMHVEHCRVFFRNAKGAFCRVYIYSLYAAFPSLWVRTESGLTLKSVLIQENMTKSSQWFSTELQHFSWPRKGEQNANMAAILIM